MKEKQKHIKRNWNPRKLCMAGTALLVMFVITVYGVASRAFAYETVTWSGDFTPARREWSYSTNSYADVSTTGFSERVWMANQGLHGFGRSVGSGTTTAVMEESKMAAYIRSKSSEVKPGDTVTWSADIETTFRYKLNGSVVVSSVHGTAAEANKADNTDRTSEKNGMTSATSKFEFPDWSSNNKGALVFALTDSSGIPRGFCHQFGDSGYRQNLVNSGSFQMKAPMLTVDRIPEEGGTVSKSGTTHTTIRGNLGDFAFEGTKVTVTAAVNDGYVFEGWYEDSGTQVSTSTTYTFYMPSSDYKLTAKFTKK